jgi:hypothetical protein
MKKLLLLLTLIPLNLLANSENQLTLYFIPSPIGIDWSTPSSLAWTAMKNRLSLQSRFMGHVFVEVQCNTEKQVTGMVGKNFDYLRQLLLNNRGLGILYHSFDGSLEEKSEVEEEIKDLSESKRINFVRFNINKGQCDRALTYLKEYREKNVGRYYGLANRPLYAEGSGCSAFGASFAEVTGVLNQEIQDAWSQTVNIPLEFAGPPLKEEGVNLLKLMMNASKWASETEPHKKLTFWSPDRMFQWVNQKIQNSKDQNQYSIINIGKASGVLIDKSHLPAPSGPIWLQHLDPNLISKKLGNTKK